MNENPEGTPNPLNSGSAPEVPVTTSTAAPAEPINAGEQPGASNAQPVATNAPTVGTNDASLDPSGRVMEQAPTVAEEKPKKKTGLIVGVIVGAILIVGGGIGAAVAMMLMNSTDPVTAAMNKIMSGEAPNNVLVDGTVSLVINDDESPVKKINIDLDTGIKQDPMVNTSSAVITLSLDKMNDVSFEFDEIYADSGDLYLKLDGASDAIEQSGLVQYLTSNPGTIEVTDCTTDENGEENCITEYETESEEERVETEQSFNNIISIIKTIDGDWIRLSTDDMTMMADGFADSNVSCITDLVSDINKNQTALDLYKKYPFVTSSDKEITIQKKNNPIFKVGLDDENFVSFVNSIKNTELSQDIYTCLDLEDSASIDTESIKEISSKFPLLYTEVNSDHNFTRLYLESDADDGSLTTTIDLSFTYPSDINIDEPDTYVDFSSVLERIFSDLYELDEETEQEATE